MVAATVAAWLSSMAEQHGWRVSDQLLWGYDIVCVYSKRLLRRRCPVGLSPTYFFVHSFKKTADSQTMSAFSCAGLLSVTI
jgi:hypothetical protein